MDLVVRNALQFWQDSDANLQEAVKTAATATGWNDRMLFVKSTFAEPNALFADAPLLWGFGDDFAPEDEVATARGTACDLQYPGPVDLVARGICHYASVGHPSAKGAAVLARAVRVALGAA